MSENVIVYTNLIRKSYLEILNREPDDAGLNYYLSLMKDGKIDEIKLREILLNSDEYNRIQLKNQFTSKFDMSENFYGKCWIGQDYIWYNGLFEQTPIIHSDFINYFKKKIGVKTVLEVGCGAGVYPIRFKELLLDKQYVGCDISESAIYHCKTNSNFNFICGDFLKMNVKDKYDLIFSHSVIDHVYDIDLFLSKIIQITKRYAYIAAYNGFYPNLEEHEMKYVESGGYYMNKLSVKQIKKTLFQNGLKENEFIIRSQETGHSEVKLGTVIEIEIS